MGNITEDQRKANANPNLEKGKKEDTDNYRPLSLISNPGKAMEQLVLETISRHIEQECDQDSQHGFTKGKSCLTSLINFYREITSLVDKWRTVDIVYLDLVKF